MFGQIKVGFSVGSFLWSPSFQVYQQKWASIIHWFKSQGNTCFPLSNKPHVEFLLQGTRIPDLKNSDVNYSFNYFGQAIFITSWVKRQGTLSDLSSMCRLFVLKMSWNVTSLLSLDMLMQRYTNVKMKSAQDPCATSKLITLEYIFFFLILCFVSHYIHSFIFLEHMEVEKKILLCVTFLGLRPAGWNCWGMYLLLIAQ